MGHIEAWIVYQPLIVGLGAVVLATVGNTVLEWYRLNLRDQREAATLRRAFSEELRAHRRFAVASMSDDQKRETSGSFMVPLDQFMPVYENMIGRIGVLSPAQVAAVLEAYSYIILGPKNLILLGQIHRDPFATFIEVPVSYREVLTSLSDELTKVIDRALAALAG